MNGNETELGKLLSTHAMAPAFLQRAAIVAFVSFLFFLLTLIALYIRQHIGYFALSTAFLVVYVFTLVGWVLQRRNVVRIYENGLSYRKFRAAWREVTAIKADSRGLEITRNRGEKTLVPKSFAGYDQILRAVTQGVRKNA